MIFRSKFQEFILCTYPFNRQNRPSKSTHDGKEPASEKRHRLKSDIQSLDDKLLHSSRN